MEVPLPDDSEIAPAVLERLRSLPPINVYRQLASVEPMLIPWSDMTAGVYRCSLDGRLREIGIRRQARTARAPYELHQHQFVARNNGVSETELTAILRDTVVTSLDPVANLVCKVADELETSATLSDDTQAALYDALGRQPATELIITLSFYCAVARFANATRLAIESDNPLAATANPTRN